MSHCYSTSPNRFRIKCTVSHSNIHILLHFCAAISYIKLLWKAEDTCFTWLTYFGNLPPYYIITSCASRWGMVIVCWSFGWISEKVLWEYISSFTTPHDWFGVCDEQYSLLSQSSLTHSNAAKNVTMHLQHNSAKLHKTEGEHHIW